MVTIGIVRSTGSLQGDRVLRGVYGQFIPGEVDGGVGKFQIAPEFKRISHLFGLLDNGQSPIAPRDIYTIEVEDHQEHLAKAQLMHAMSARWAQLYQGVAPAQVGMLNAMMNAESANVAAAAKSHLVSMGMRTFLVPVSCEMTSYTPGNQLATERELMASLQEPTALELADGEAVDIGTEPLVSRLQQPARDEAAAAPTAADVPPPAWAGAEFNNGVIAQLRGSIVVLAPSAQQAREAAQIALRLGADTHATGVAVEFMPEGITAVRALPAEATQDFEDSGFDPDFDDRDPRERG